MGKEVWSLGFSPRHDAGLVFFSFLDGVDFDHDGETVSRIGWPAF